MRIRPTEAINAAALAVLVLLTLYLRQRLADPAGLLWRYTALGIGLAVIASVARRADRLPTPVRLLVDFYPAAFLPIVFNTLEPLIHALRGGPRDEYLIAADRALFGVDVTVWMQRFVRPALSDTLFVFYATYYFLALILGFILWRKDHATARRYIFTLMVCYYVSYAGYFLLPALGPRFAQAHEYTVSIVSSPISRAISDTINQLEKTKFDVFPSGHTLISVTVLLVAWKRARRAFWFFLPVATGLIIATVYCRYHYVADVLAGITCAVTAVPIGDRVYDAWTEREERASAPVAEVSP
ncbi:MAG TPA: phosphatase PAP2 family protein [Thermoanaerobaculia bacterium]|nr:phosphatase PAP2 family protein [Thermoanaerobaculia bacterium]